MASFRFFVFFCAVAAGSAPCLCAQQSSAAGALPQASDILGVFTSLPVVQASAYGASGSAATGTCSGTSGSATLTCSFAANDFAAGQGIHIVGAGPAPVSSAILYGQPLVLKIGSQTGSHTYCYVVDTADPLEGISAPSAPACIGNEPALSYTGAWNALGLIEFNSPSSPAFLWYVSEDDGPYQLMSITGFLSSTIDVGQRPGTRGGWPNNLPAGNPGIAKNEDFYATVASVHGSAITLTAPLPSSVSNAVTMHDDTQAVENAILAADAGGGGTVQLGAGTFRIQMPNFLIPTSNMAPLFTTALASDVSYEKYGSLYLPGTSHGKLNITGSGSKTIIDTAPDHGAVSSLFEFGVGTPPNTLTGVLKMQNVEKGATTVTLTGGASGLAAGDDIYLYSGSFDTAPCPDVEGSSGECHYSELNTIASISGNTLHLVYPTSKRFYDDGSSSFGLVKVLTSPHDIAIQNLTINTYNPITFTGEIYGLVVNGLTINGFLHAGAFSGGFKRDVTIENSTWGVGVGDATWSGVEEYDQFTNLSFLNDTISGYGAAGAESGSLMPRLYASEGSSQLTFTNNSFTGISVYVDQTTDDTFSGNTFTDAVLRVGEAYGNVPFLSGPAQNASFDSFGSQTALTIKNNTVTTDAAYNPPFLMQLGHFDTATVSGNTLSAASNTSIGALAVYSGTFTGNTLTLTGNSPSIGIVAIPDQSPATPAAPFTIENNSFSLPAGSANVYVPDEGFTDTPGVCIQSNSTKGPATPLMVADTSDTPQICSSAAQ